MARWIARGGLVLVAAAAPSGTHAYATDSGISAGQLSSSSSSSPSPSPTLTPTPTPTVAAGISTSPGPGGRAGARALHAQGLARLKAGDVAEAARLFARALDKDPDSAIIATDLGFVLGKLGRRDEAEAALRTAIARDPRRFYAYVNLADLMADDPARWERRDQAVALLEKGLDAVRDDAKGRLLLLLRLANFERVVGRTGAARARLEPLLAAGAAGAAPLTRAQRKRVLDALEAIALDERAQALEDWPTPAPTPAQTAVADDAAGALDAGRAAEAFAALDPLVRRAPTWPRARFLRARSLEALGRVDEAVRDLEIAVNLAPSSAGAWRALGRLLAIHGGALEADRADEALRHALVLEPSWTELRTLRAQLARRRAALAAAPATPHAAGPSERARALYREAEEWIEVGDPAGLGRDLVAQALAESPGYVEAAVSAYALTGRVPPETVEALWEDGPALWALVSGIRQLGKGAAGELGTGAARRGTSAGTEGTPTPTPTSTPTGMGMGAATPTPTLTPTGMGMGAATGMGAGMPLGQALQSWIDRAVALDVQEARFARALSRAGAGDRTGALADLVAYVAREPRPAHLAEARALRAGLAGHEARPAAERLARIRLLEGRPDAALGALGGECAADQGGERLRALGLVHEYGDERAAARRCYELAIAAGDQAALGRLARLDARLPDAELRAADRAPLERAAGKDIAAAYWALARLDYAAGDPAAALARVDRALALAGRPRGDARDRPVSKGAPDGDTDADADADGQGDADGTTWIKAARAAHDDMAAVREAAERHERERRRRLEAAALALGALLLALVARRRLHGRTVAAALRRSPSLFPEVGRAVADLRHDVLKHRAGLLGLVADRGVARADIRRALTEPEPTSAAVAAVYDHLMQAARGLGMTLRPLGREPTFGPLARDLARAEALLRRARGGDDARGGAHGDADADADGGSDAALLAIDGRLRGTHADRLDALLQLGPRTRLDAGEVGAWIGALEAATRRAGSGWAAPALLLGELAVDFPVERGALHAIFANLLRNAQAAVAGQDAARVIVRVDRERDVTGRQVARLLVGDSATAALTLETIEARESGRGLAIVRDLVRQWRGHLVVRAEPAPFSKQVGACFPT